MILISSWNRLCPTLWSQVLSREWRYSWGSADRRCSNYIWVIDNLIAHKGAPYIKDLTGITHTLVNCNRQHMDNIWNIVEMALYGWAPLPKWLLMFTVNTNNDSRRLDKRFITLSVCSTLYCMCVTGIFYQRLIYYTLISCLVLQWPAQMGNIALVHVHCSR